MALIVGERQLNSVTARNSQKSCKAARVHTSQPCVCAVKYIEGARGTSVPYQIIVYVCDHQSKPGGDVLLGMACRVLSPKSECTAASPPCLELSMTLGASVSKQARAHNTAKNTLCNCNVLGTGNPFDRIDSPRMRTLRRFLAYHTERRKRRNCEHLRLILVLTLGIRAVRGCAALLLALWRSSSTRQRCVLPAS